MSIEFTKMQAYGNDYVYINAIKQSIADPNALAVRVSKRRFGVGADGMVLICPSEKADFRMRIFDPDGTEAEMCGNAIRSVAKYVFDYGLTSKTEIIIETLGGTKTLSLDIENGKAVNIEADIGLPIYTAAEIPANTRKPEFFGERVHIIDREFILSSLSWGNPHTVAFIECPLAEFDVEKYGRAIENKLDIFPKRTNVTFAKVISRTHIAIREWERGTGETIGCGTGCCTAFCVARRNGLVDGSVTVTQIGGDLFVREEESNGHIIMKGPSHVVYDGVLKD